MIWFLAFFFAQATAPTQIERGDALFQDAARGCASCHALKGKGTAIGPDLKGIARLTPKAIAMAVHSTVTQYVVVVKLKAGDQFPAMPPGNEPNLKIYDLSKTPPALHEVGKADVASTSANNGWKHPPATAKLTDEEMADLVAYIRFAGANNRQPVSPDDVQ